MAKKNVWVEVPDHEVRHIWARVDCDCGGQSGTPQGAEVVGPDFYWENGTPQCECGVDLEYVRTEILLRDVHVKE